MIAVGSDAPSFQLPGVDDGEIGEYALDDYDGESIVVLAFYPADFSPACTDELCALQDLELFAMQRDVTIFGISPDSVYSHRAFATEYNLGFPLLSDSVGNVAEQYGVLQSEFEGHERVPKRSVFVLDANLTVEYAWCGESPVDLPDLEAVRDAVEAVQDDGTAIERYRTACNHFRFGRSEFETARTAFEREDWSTADATFGEALGYFDEAAAAFESARRFGSDPVAHRAASAAETADAYRRAAKWYAESAEYYADDAPEWGDEYRDDAIEALHSSPDDGDISDLYPLSE